jgi:hypothetical protein
MSLDPKRYKLVLAGSWFLVDPEGLVGLVFISICKDPPVPGLGHIFKI